MIRTAGLKDTQSWEELLPIITIGYNSSVNRTLGETPFYCMFGRDPRVPLDLVIPRKITHRYAIGQENNYSVSAELQARMQQIRETIQETMEKNLSKTRQQINRHRKTREFQVGEKVLLKVPQKKGEKKKFYNKYQGIYRIEKVINKVNLVIRSITGSKKSQTVHVNRVIRFEDKPREAIIDWASHYDELVTTGNQVLEDPEWIDLLLEN